jgi:hypothetical protein
VKLVPSGHLIVVNSAEAAFDLFDKRSAIYSDRVQYTLTNICCCEKSLIQMLLSRASISLRTCEPESVLYQWPHLSLTTMPSSQIVLGSSRSTSIWTKVAHFSTIIPTIFQCQCLSKVSSSASKSRSRAIISTCTQVRGLLRPHSPVIGVFPCLLALLLTLHFLTEWLAQ